MKKLLSYLMLLIAFTTSAQKMTQLPALTNPDTNTITFAVPTSGTQTYQMKLGSILRLVPSVPKLWVPNQGNSAYVQVDTTKNVGIGTTFPAAKLYIVDTALIPNTFLVGGWFYGQYWPRFSTDQSTYYEGIAKDGNGNAFFQTLGANAWYQIFDTTLIASMGGVTIQQNRFQYIYGGYPTSGQVLTCDNQGNASWQNASGAGWSLTGNSGTDPSSNYVGTGDGQIFYAQSFLTSNQYAQVQMQSPNGGGTGAVNLIVYDSVNDTHAQIQASSVSAFIDFSDANTNTSIQVNGNRSLIFDFATLSPRADSSYTFPTGNYVGSLTNDGEGNLSWQPQWGLSGNSGTNPSANYIGTSDATQLNIGVNGAYNVQMTPYIAGTQNFAYQINDGASQLFSATSNNPSSDNTSVTIGDVQGYWNETLISINDPAQTIYLNAPNVTMGGNTQIGSASYVWPNSNSAGSLTNDGSGNLSWGYQTLNQTVVAGNSAGQDILVGADNLTIGEGAFANPTNTALGYFPLSSNVSGGNDVGIGYLTLQFNTSGSNNTAINNGALQQNIDGNYDNAIGVGALGSSQHTSRNNTFGYNSMGNLRNGNENVAMGDGAMSSADNCNFTVALGYNSCAVTNNGDANVGVGTATLYNNTNGYNNTAVGNGALITNTTGAHNVAIGSGADVASGGLNGVTCIGYGVIGSASNTTYIGGNNIVTDVALRNYASPTDAQADGTLAVKSLYVLNASATLPLVQGMVFQKY